MFRFHRHHAPPGVRGGRRHDQGTAALPVCARGDAARARPASAAPPGCSLSALRGGAVGAACRLPGAAEAPHGTRWHLRSALAEPWGSGPGGSGSAQSSASLGVWGRRTPAKVNVVLHRAGRYSCPAACTVSLCARSRWPRARPGAQGSGALQGLSWGVSVPGPWVMSAQFAPLSNSTAPREQVVARWAWGSSPK